MKNEQCWLLIGGMEENLWWGRRFKQTVGKPASVDFDYDYVLRRHRKKNDVVGFAHTHPNMPATPSLTDFNTMHAWVTCLGKPLICAIRGGDGLKVYCFHDDENLPERCFVKQVGHLLIGTVYNDGQNYGEEDESKQVSS